MASKETAESPVILSLKKKKTNTLLMRSFFVAYLSQRSFFVLFIYFIYGAVP